MKSDCQNRNNARVEKCSKSPPKKCMKMDNKNMFSTTESHVDFKNLIESKENCHYEDDECYIIDEIRENNLKTSQTMARKSIRKNHCSHETSLRALNAKMDVSKPSEIPNSTYDCRAKATGELKAEHVPDKLLNSCRISVGNSNCGDKNRDTLFQNNIKRRIRFLNQSHHLEDKYHYNKLLQKMSNRTSPVTPPRPRETLLIDLTEEKSCVAINRSRENLPQFSRTNFNDHLTNKSSSYSTRGIRRVNSFQEVIENNPVADENVANQILLVCKNAITESKKYISVETAKVQVLNENNKRAYDETLAERLREYIKITSPVVIEDDLEYEEKSVLPSLTREQEFQINQALVASPSDQILAEKFGLQIKRRDMHTLKGMNWLNDEIINFYMNLIMERSKLGKLPSVHAFNTFFYPKLISGGHTSLKRWTKKVDIFSYDMVLVPVHMGMHWCMSIIDFRTKEVRYYDSMGSPNNTCLQSLLTYLEDESQDKKKTYYSTTNWKKNNVENIPQQMNGSDCGVFACMFAEHVSRDSPILFTQDNMPYFRRKMVLEILEGRLLT